MSDRIEALKRALSATPDDHALRGLLVEEFMNADRDHEAFPEISILVEAMALPPELALTSGHIAIDLEQIDTAERIVAQLREAGMVDGVRALEDRLLGARQKVLSEADPSTTDLESTAAIDFSAVGGLDDLKKLIHRRIVLPFNRPDLYEKYGRKAGGGLLLYGPPGCGKTLLARATAGEVGLPFYNLRIEDIVDPYFGRSEQNLALAFDRARELTPCVLFIDEVDAIGYARGRRNSDAGRQLVDVLLQQLDSVGSDTSDLLVIAATNAPWDVDDALLRTGRFDRQVFVPPPDSEARSIILDVLMTGRHTEHIQSKPLAKATEFFSGADLRGLVELAVDAVIEEALDTGSEPPLAMRHLDEAVGHMRPTTLEWLNQARNYVEFANQSERWNDIAAYLKSREGRRALKEWKS